VDDAEKDRVVFTGGLQYSDADQEQENLSENEELLSVQEIGICTLLGNVRFTMAALSSALCYFNYSFMEPILAERLTDFSLTSIQIGMFFAIWPVFYIPASVLVQYMPRTVEKRVTIIMSCLFTAFCFSFVGPSQLLNFSDSLIFMGIG